MNTATFAPTQRSEAFFEDIDTCLTPGVDRGTMSPQAGDRLDRWLRAAPLVAGVLCVMAALATLAL